MESSCSDNTHAMKQIPKSNETSNQCFVLARIASSLSNERGISREGGHMTRLLALFKRGGAPVCSESHRGLPISFSTLLLANVLYWICAGVYTPFLSAYFTRRGFSSAEVGTLLAVQPICALMVQPIWSFVADRTGRRKQVLIVLCVLSAAVSLVYYVSDGFVASLATTLAFSIFFQALLPLCDSLVIGASEMAGIDFSRVRMGGTIGYAVVVAIVGHVLEVAPEIQFIIVSMALLVFAFQASRLPESDARCVVPRDEADLAEFIGGGIQDSDSFSELLEER